MIKTQKHEIKMDYLLEKGMAILWCKGYNGTSVNDIVKAADIPKGSFYFYFDSKEDFAVKAIEAYFSQHFTPAAEILMNTNVSPKQRLLGFYEYRNTMLKEELNCKMGCLASNLGSEMADHSERIRKVIVEKEKMIHAQIASVMKEAQDQGELDPSSNPADIVAFIEDAGKGAMISMKEMQSSYPIDNFMSMIKLMLFK